MVFHLFSQHCFPPSSNISSIYTIFHEFPPCFPGSHAILPRSCSSPPSPAPRVPGAGAARWSNAKVWTTSRLTGWWSNWDRGIWWFGRAGFPAGRWLGRDSRIFQLSSSYIVYIDIYIYRCIFCFYYSAWDGGISSMFHVSSSYLSEMAIRQLIVFTLRFTWDQVQKTQQIL